jgi:hypothetical protein
LDGQEWKGEKNGAHKSRLKKNGSSGETCFENAEALNFTVVTKATFLTVVEEFAGKEGR